MSWVPKKQLDALKTRIEELVRTLREVEDRAFLIDIQRTGRKTRFIFAKNNKVVEIETMSLISDDLKDWKDKLLK